MYACALCICMGFIWIMFYIINHHFPWHRLRVIWSNWTTEEPPHCTARNKQFKIPIQVGRRRRKKKKKKKKSISILNTLTKTRMCLIHLFSHCPFGRINRQARPRRKNRSRYVSEIWRWIIVVINDLWVLTGAIWRTSEANSATQPIWYW